ncbi:MAG: chitobiase/beta-hexosaminidase C-terminal domain-containing protein [Oscillospiraceae bacterium]|nr:chitobiase/beta-hexosaminidase C-terminal domain-containing protein [Oscillospiraceae bacterium]
MRKLSSLLLTVVLLLSIALSMPFSAKAEGLQVAYRTQAQINAYMKQHPAAASDAVSFKTSPSLSGSYSAGEMSAASLQSCLNMINQIRYIAGLSSVALDSNFNRAAQAVSLIGGLNGTISHYPNRPNSIAGGQYDALYKLAYDGAARSNLYVSYPARTPNQAMLLGYMADNDKVNIVTAGHRRWALFPSLGKIGFGYVNAQFMGNMGAYSTMYHGFDRSNAKAQEKNVAWPAQNMPASFFDAAYPWSLSVGEDLSGRKISVTVTRKSNGQKWNFVTLGDSSAGYFNVDNGTYGQQGCVIFRPDGVVVAPGESYDVSISGTPQPIAYTVNFFDPNISSPQQTSPVTTKITPTTVTAKPSTTVTAKPSTTVTTKKTTTKPPATVTTAPPKTPTAPKPTANKKAKTYTGQVKVTLKSTVKGAKIHYTTNGKTPTKNSPYVKSGKTVTVKKSSTLRFRVIAAGYKNSAVSSVKYKIRTAAPKKALPASAKVKKNTAITIKAPKGTTIYYTTNGKKSTTKSQKVKAGTKVRIVVKRNTTVKVAAKKSGQSLSAVVTRQFRV